MGKFVANTGLHDSLLTTDDIFARFEKQMDASSSVDRIKRDLAEKILLTSFLENRQLSSALKEKNKKAPFFYIKERIYSFIGFFIVVLIGLGLLTFTVYSWFFLSKEDKNIIYLIVPVWVIFVMLLYVYLNRLLKINSEIKSYDFIDDQREPSINILKIYKRCKLSYLNLNYLGACVYLTCSVAILVTLTYVWAANLIFSAGKVNNYGALNFLEYQKTPDGLPVLGADNTFVFINSPIKWPLYLIIVFGSIISGYFLFHIVMIFINARRASAIESYYKKPLYSESDMIAITKKRNKRNLILFLAYVASLFLVVFVFFKFIRKMLLAKRK